MFGITNRCITYYHTSWTLVPDNAVAYILYRPTFPDRAYGGISVISFESRRKTRNLSKFWKGSVCVNRKLLSWRYLMENDRKKNRDITTKKGQPKTRPPTNVPINIRLANINITHRQPTAQNLSDLDHSMLLQVKSDCAVGLPMYVWRPVSV